LEISSSKNGASLKTFHSSILVPIVWHWTDGGAGYTWLRRWREAIDPLYLIQILVAKEESCRKPKVPETVQ